MRKKQLAFVVELDRCIGCKGCQVACKMENGTPLGSDRIKVRKVGPTGTYPNLEMYFLPTMCQQCEEPVCARVCPTGAIYKNESDGVVKIDREKCIGCHSCNNACPYHANTFKALHYGDVNDPDSEVSRLLAEAGEDHVFQFQDFGNHPSARYILKHAAWQDILPQELDVVSFGKGGKKYYE